MWRKVQLSKHETMDGSHFEIAVFGRSPWWFSVVNLGGLSWKHDNVFNKYQKTLPLEPSESS